MFDRVQLTGMDDYYTYGRNEKEYSMVSAYSLSSADYMIAVGAIGAALLFFIVFK
jgi:hypothetical protein